MRYMRLKYAELSTERNFHQTSAFVAVLNVITVDCIRLLLSASLQPADRASEFHTLTAIVYCFPANIASIGYSNLKEDIARRLLVQIILHFPGREHTPS